MTKINKKQFYVIAGLAGIIATAAFAFPLQTAESGVAPDCGDPEFVFLFPDGPCIPIELCAEFLDGVCVSLFPEPGDGLFAPCGETGEGTVQHWDKIIFKNEEDLFKLDGTTLAVEEGSIMDIKEIDDPTKIEFPMKKAVERSNEVWRLEGGELITLKDLKLIDVEYAIICVGFFGDVS